MAKKDFFNVEESVTGELSIKCALEIYRHGELKIIY
jgi:hypothetical protein